MNRAGVVVALGGVAWSTISSAQPPFEPADQTALAAPSEPGPVSAASAPAAPMPAAASVEGARRAHGSSKSAALAGALALGIPALGVGAFFVGDLVGSGPGATTMYVASLGAFAAGPTVASSYAGKPWNAGTKIRLIGVGLLAIGGYYWLYTDAGQNEEIIGPRGILTLTGAIVYGAGMITELGISLREVGRHNRRVSSMQLSVAPLADSGGLRPGLVVVGRY
jgi:hypothetical protein